MLAFEKIYKDRFGKVLDKKITAQVASWYPMIKNKTPAQQIEELTWLISVVGKKIFSMMSKESWRMKCS